MIGKRGEEKKRERERRAKSDMSVDGEKKEIISDVIS